MHTDERNSFGRAAPEPGRPAAGQTSAGAAWELGRPGRRTPRQERSRSTVDAIFEAAARVVDEAGMPGATTGRIAHVAGVSIGSLYQYFPRKEALFGALTERAMETDLQRVREAVDRARDMSLEAGIREVIRAAFGFVLERPRVFAWMLRYLPSLVHSPAVEAWERALIAETRRFLEDHRAELVGFDLDLHATAGVGAVRGGLLILARERPSALEDPALLLELATNLCLGSLRANRSAGARAGDGTRTET